MFFLIYDIHNIRIYFIPFYGKYLQISMMDTKRFIVFNPFVPNAPFLYPLKTSENRAVSWCFQVVEKGALGTNGLISSSNVDCLSL